MASSGYSALRKGRFSQPGYCYHVTIVTCKRQPIFLDVEHARAACRTFSSQAVLQHCLTLSFVVMPDHVHWLLELHDDLSKAVKLYKSKVSMAVGRPVWDEGFHDHAIRGEENIRNVARYIVANPLRAGLVDNIGLYPYWDAVWVTTE